MYIYRKAMLYSAREAGENSPPGTPGSPRTAPGTEFISTRYTSYIKKIYHNILCLDIWNTNGQDRQANRKRNLFRFQIANRSEKHMQIVTSITSTSLQPFAQGQSSHSAVE